MMIKSFLIIRFSFGKEVLFIFSEAKRSLTHQFSAKLHNACDHDIERHVTGIYE